jgi:PAS domain S-box-containing protein
VPVYSFYQGAFGKGIVGGYIKNFSVQAKTTAEMGLRVLKGIPIQEIPAIQKKDLEYMFDWRQLKRWSISENRLPPGSIVKFKELTTWDRYKGQIIGALILILFQTLIIFYLLYQRRIRLRAQEQVLQAELKYRTVADYTFDWEYWQSPDGSLRYVSPSCERVCGYTTQDFIRNPSLLQDIIVTKDKAVWDEHRCINKKEMQSEEIQFRIQRPNGEIRWIEHACQPVFDQKGKKRGVRASNRDITRRKQSEESLKAISEEAGLLAGKLLNAQELERARVARELHDDITQRLAVMNIEVDNLEMQHQSLAEPLKEKLQQLGIDLGELSSDIHMISRQLHPSILYELGLIKAIETECNNYTRLRRISPTLDLDNTIKDVPKEIALCIYRILQEGLRNIGKHAMASDIQVRLCMRKNTICLFLKDNGIGFDSASAKERAGIGLASMVERARLVNGDLSIESGTEIGTTIKLKIPIPLPPRYN